VETIGSFLLLSVFGSGFLWHFKDQDKLSFLDKWLHLMFVKLYDVVFVACYNQLMFIKDDDDDDRYRRRRRRNPFY
jgi:hypothetical protein